jgi:4-amino-4-deoxy-L-arabinose transferase-like glycosyltransferase
MEVRQAHRAWPVSPLDIVLAVGVLAGFGLRFWALAGRSLGSLDADEAVWGLTARHLLHGEWSTFLWGQPYGGTQEAILTAAGFRVAGTGTLLLKLVPAALYLAAAVLVWRVGRRTVGEPAARIAAVLFWIWPSYFVWRSTRAYGFYGSGLVLGLAILLLALRLSERRSRRDAALLGLATGLGVWATPQIVVLALPALVWLVWRRPGVLRDWWIALTTAVVGALPWLVWNLRNGWDSLHSAEARSSVPEQFRSLFTDALPTALGLRVPFSLEWIVGPVVGGIVCGLAVVGLVWLIWRRPRRLEVLVLACLTFVVIYAVSPYGFLNTEPRYLTLIQPVLALLIGYAVCRPWFVAAASLAAAVTLSAVGLALMERHRLATFHINGVPVPENIGPLLRVLDRAGAKTVFADYWVAYPIDFESRERIVATPTAGTGDIRYLPWDETVRRSANPAHVFVRGTGREARARAKLLAAGYRRVEVGGFSVYLRGRPTRERG